MVQKPHEVLGLAVGASPEAIRARYLELIRRHTPEKDPSRFAEIRAAYDELRDPVRQIERMLFNLQSDDTVRGIENELMRRVLSARLGVDQLAALSEML
jgi:DnaJ-class molecular chaperone